MRTALLAALALSFSGATCSREGDTASSPQARPAASPSAGSPAEGSGGPGPPEGSARLSETLRVPGMDFSGLSSGAQRELAQVFTDEFCHCGCPHTVGQCLKEHPGCRHGKRMANLAAIEAQGGTPGVEIIQKLGGYYQSFREARRTPKVDERMCKGARDARITLVEFADFECPGCGFVRPVLEELASKRAGTLRLCFLPYPLPGHASAMPAAVAALVARDRGKFWEMHDRLFANQLSLSVPAIKEMAVSLGIPAAEVQKALDSGKYAAEIAGFKEQGKAAGLVQTPTLLINGRAHAHELGFTFERLDHAVDDELEWLSGQNAWTRD